MSRPPLTALYVPGDRPDRFDKAAASGADVVLLDLEDAVAPAAKAAAREAVVAWLAGRPDDAPGPAVQVRVATGDGDDLDALRALPRPVTVRLPKVETPRQVSAVVDALGPSTRVSVLLETALGVQRADELAAHPAVAELGLGEADLASDLGSGERAVLDHARLRVLYAARAAGLPPPMQSVYPAVADLDGLREDTEHGRRLGLRGRVAVHPSQLAVIREVFTPSVRDVAWAREVLAAASRGGVSTLSDGSMVDAAMLGRARAVLDLLR